MKEYTCKYCGKKFTDFNKYRGHLGWEGMRRVYDRVDIQKVCPICGQEYTVQRIQHEDGSIRPQKGERKTCSLECSKKLTVRNTDKFKVKNAICVDCGSNILVNVHTALKHARCSKCKEENRRKIVIKSKTKERVCTVCGKIFIGHTACCSKECLQKARSNGGFKGSKMRATTARSKNEMLFCELCCEVFRNVAANEVMFNGWDADVILKDEKIAIMWNGKWHYEEICKGHSLKQVQNRDKLKIKEIYKMGYTPVVIKDMGKYNPSFVMEQFNLMWL